MAYGVIVLILMIFVIWIGKLLFSLIQKHGKLCFALLVALIVIVVYAVNAGIPIDPLLSSLEKVGNWLWELVHQNTVIGAALVYAGIAWVCFLAVKTLFRMLLQEWYRLLVGTSLALASIALVMIGTWNMTSVVIAGEMLGSISVLWLYRVVSMDRIGWVKDARKALNKIELLHMQLALQGLVYTSGVVEIINDVLDTHINAGLAPSMIFILYMVLEIRWVVHVFSGYQQMNQYVKQNGLFEYKTLSKNLKLEYLEDKEEFEVSVVNNMVRKKKLYPIPVGKQLYLNQSVWKLFEKLIKSNLSSEEIEKRIDCDFGIYGFEAIYKAVFEKTKRYQIDFAKNSDSKLKQGMQDGISAIEFVLMRYPIEKHPLLQEEIEIRKAYILALNTIVSRGGVDRDKWGAKLEEYQQVFGVKQLEGDPEEAVSLFAAVVKRKVHLFKTVKSDYSYLLLLEAIYFKNLLSTRDITYKEIERTFEQLKIKPAHRDFVYQYIKAMFIERDITEAETLLESKVNPAVQKVLKYIHQNIMWNERYVRLSQYKVAVCATLSAGKSTFINALLGMDYIPAKNEACTAKITTIRDNDNIQKLIGYYSRTDGKKIYSNIIDRDVLNTWNEDKDINEMILEGDIEEVSCQDGIMVIHDTPGTNNSKDVSHHNKTIDFLKKNEIDLIIYLINAEYISTNDTENLLLELQSIKREKTQIVFGLNKIDSFDEEGDDSLAFSMNALIGQLHSYGIENPIIFPFSANAARIFKLVLKGYELTKREKRDFVKLLERFSQFDAADYVANAEAVSVSEYYHKLKTDKQLVIGDEEYSYNHIVGALCNTGIFCIENWIAKEMGYNLSFTARRKPF